MGLVFAALMVFAFSASAAPPRVVITSPDNGEVDVAADTSEIRIQFDQAMDPRGRSIVGGGDSFPEISGKPQWVDEQTMVIPVKLKADHQYQLNLNSDTFKGFCSRSGEPAEWYPVSFSTRAQGAEPVKADVTPQQNKFALAALRQAIDQDYSYRDLKKIDWPARIKAHQTDFENARSANEFARLTARLLREADDGHISVQAGDIHIGTHANSVPPNVNFRILQQVVGDWTEDASGLVYGRIDGIGYIAISACTREQANAFDTALDKLKDSTALIIDARFNGGGDEGAAQRVAGRFAAKPAVYSRDRIREAGVWKGPFDRVLKPRDDAARYSGPVAVLIGPKTVSSAESFVLMMKHGGNAKLFGSATGGSSGRPIAHELGNGVTVYLPSWEDQAPDGTPLQNHGIDPDVAVRTTMRDLRQSDAVLEAAVKHLQNGTGDADTPKGK